MQGQNAVSFCAESERFQSSLYNAAAAKASQTRCRVVLSEVDDKPSALSRLEYYGTRTEYYEPIGKLDSSSDWRSVSSRKSFSAFKKNAKTT